MEDRPKPEPPSNLATMAGALVGSLVIIVAASYFDGAFIFVLLGCLLWAWTWIVYLIRHQQEKYQKALDNYWKKQQ